MQRKLLNLVSFLFLISSLSSQATIINILENDPSFNYQEGFDSFSTGFYSGELSVMGGVLSLTGSSNNRGSGTLITDTWNYIIPSSNPFVSSSSGVIIPNTLNNMLAIDVNGFVKLTFSQVVYSFGGFFGTGSFGAQTAFNFTEQGGIQSSTTRNFETAQNSGALEWVGFYSNIGFSEIIIEGRETVMDTFKLSTSPTPVPEPSTFSILLLSLFGLQLLARKKAKK